jgi:hypothetical protein
MENKLPFFKHYANKLFILIMKRRSKKIIKLMKDEYDMTPSFNDDGFYTFDLKPQPSFKDAKLKI